MPEPRPWGDIALTTSREQFTAVYRHPFLLGTQALVRPRRPQRTGKIDITGIIRTQKAEDSGESGDGEPVVYAITKVQTTFPSMITVGRTANNDVAIDDVQVSKFHAFFRTGSRGTEVGDAGSTNGTRVRGEPLVPKGPAVVIASGDPLSFGGLEFVFLSPAECWSRLMSLLEKDWDT
jgi:hypothetical protein